MNARKCVLTLFKHSRMNQAMSEEEENKKIEEEKSRLSSNYTVCSKLWPYHDL